MTHTKGPWDIGGIFDSDKNWKEDRRAITADDGTKYHRRLTVARIETPPNYTDERPEIEANAYLIAAAPELLEALEIARQSLMGDVDPGKAVEVIDATIAKARGVK